MSYFWWYLVDKTNSLKIKAILDGLGWPAKIKELSVAMTWSPKIEQLSCGSDFWQ
jgi:hypothetical protein